MIILELTSKDAESCKSFRQYQDDITALEKSGFFNFKGGKAIVHRDKNGKIQKIEINRIAYYIKL